MKVESGRTTRQPAPVTTDVPVETSTLEAPSTTPARQDGKSSVDRVNRDATRRVTGNVASKSSTGNPVIKAPTVKVNDIAPRAPSVQEMAATRLGSARPDTFGPGSMDAVGNSALESVRQLAPSKLQNGDALQALDSVKDAKVAVEIPLKAGDYKVKGVPFTIPPNTTMTVQMEVQDGKLVPARDKGGHDTGRGTKVEIHPPVDLPLWLDGNGAYVRDRGDGKGQIKADIGGFFDLNVSKKTDLGLRSVVGAFSDGSAAKTDGKSAFPEGLVQFDQMKFKAGEVTLKDNVMDMGSAKVDLAPGNKLSITGDGKSATVKGDVKVDSVGVNQDGFSLRTGPGSTSFEARYTKNADGTMSVNSSFTNMNASVEGVTSSKPRFPGDTDPDRLNLGGAQLKNSSLDVGLTLKADGKGPPQVTGTITKAHLDVSGTVNDFKLGVKDGRDDAQLRVNGGKVQGTLDISPQGFKVEGSVKGTAVDVRDLQATKDHNSLDLHHATIQGDAKIKLDSGTKNFDVEVAGKNVDVRIDDFRGGTANSDVDLSRTDISGQGTLRVSSKDGIALNGDLRIKGGFDDLKAKTPDGKTTLDVAAGARVDGFLKSINVSPDGFSMEASAQVDAKLENYKADLPGVTATGTASLSGKSDISVKPGEVAFTNTDAKVKVDLDDAKVNPEGKGFTLDAAKGSTLELNVKEMRFGNSGANMKLGPGSKLEAELDGGQITAGGTTINLEKGSRARFDIEGLKVAPGGKDLETRGKLTVDVAANATLNQPRELAPGVRVDKADVEGRAKVSVDNVALGPDGKFRLDGVKVGVEARVGQITGAVDPTGTAVGSLDKAPEKVDVKRPVDGPKDAPAGTLTTDQVQGKTAAAIAGADASVSRTAELQPMEMAKKVRNGTVKLDIPLEGRLGGKWVGVDFKPGTTLSVEAKVVDGKVVPADTKVTLSPSKLGLQGAYFDGSNRIKLDINNFPDVPITGSLPLEVDKFIDHFTSGKSSTSSGGSLPDCVKADRAKLDIKDAQFQPGKLQVPGGYVDINADTRLSVSGTMKSATLSGKVQMNGVDVVQDGVALKTGKGTADLKVSYAADDKGANLTTQLSNMNLDTQYAVEKRANGDYIHLAEGHITNGTLTMSNRLGKDAKGLPTKLESTDVKLDIGQFGGTIAGGRVTMKDADGTAQVELGRTRINGSIHVDKDQIAVHGDVQEMDVAVRDYAAVTKDGSINVDYARLKGSGSVDFSTKGGLSLEADVQKLDVRATDIKAKGAGATIDAGRTLVQGSGKVKFTSGGDLSVKGDLRMETTLDEAKLAAGSLGQQGEAHVQKGSSILANVNEFTFSKDKGLKVKGKGGLDLRVDNFSAELKQGNVKGTAHLSGGGAFEIDTKKGVDLPKGFNIDVNVEDAKVGKPGDALYLDVAKGTQLSLRNAELDLGPDGKPKRVDLGTNSHFKGKLDGGQVRIPGLKDPVILGAGSGFEFNSKRAVMDGKGNRAMEGQMTLDAIVDASKLDLAALTRNSGVTVERLDSGKARLKIGVDRVRVREDGSFELGEARLNLDASLGSVSGGRN